MSAGRAQCCAAGFSMNRPRRRSVADDASFTESVHPGLDLERSGLEVHCGTVLEARVQVAGGPAG
jgi:hypothetical protein